MEYQGTHHLPDDFRRDELRRQIDQALDRLTLSELEALYYDLSTKTSINDSPI